MSVWSARADREDTFNSLQEGRKCGAVQTNGKLCTNGFVVEFPVDPDYPDGKKIGACGVHAGDVERELKNTTGYSATTKLRNYEKEQQTKLMNILLNVGLQVRPSYDGLILQNIGKLLAWIEDNEWPADDREPSVYMKEKYDKCPICNQHHDNPGHIGIGMMCEPTAPHVFISIDAGISCSVCGLSASAFNFRSRHLIVPYTAVPPVQNTENSVQNPLPGGQNTENSGSEH